MLYLASAAVDTLAVVINRPVEKSFHMLCSMLPRIIDWTAATVPTTSACTCNRARFPETTFHLERCELRRPRLAAVDRREARFISRLPLRLNRMGTRMKNAGVSRNTVQLCTTLNSHPVTADPMAANSSDGSAYER